jgi:hypothetical protein
MFHVKHLRDRLGAERGEPPARCEPPKGGQRSVQTKRKPAEGPGLSRLRLAAPLSPMIWSQAATCAAGMFHVKHLRDRHGKGRGGPVRPSIRLDPIPAAP